jgi:hypothetical protein
VARTENPERDNVLRSIDERVAWELGCCYEDFRQPPYHQLVITRPYARAAVKFELRCPFPVNDSGEHVDLHYCTMIDTWPSIRHAVEGAKIEMAWRAIGLCFVCWEADNAGIDHLLDVGLRIPAWAKKPGTINVILEHYGTGTEFTVWLAPVDPELAAMA